MSSNNTNQTNLWMSSNNTNQTNLWMRYPTMSAMLAEFAPVGVMAEKVVPPVWYTIGFIGNPISAYIWLGQRMRRNNSSAIYLGFLSLSDMLFLLLHMMYILHSCWGYSVYNNHVTCEIFHVLLYTPQYLSALLVLGFTVERYVAVCHPFKREKWCTVRRAFIIVFILFIISLLLSSAQSYMWSYSDHLDTCDHRPGAKEGGDQSFSNMWTLVTDVLIFIFLPVTVLVFNVLVIKEICKISRNDLVKRQQNRKGNEATSTVTLLAVSFYLILTQLSATVLDILSRTFPTGDFFLSDEEIHEDPTWSELFTFLEVRKVVEVVCLSHFACYFFIYCATGKHFQKEILYITTLQGRLSFLAAMLSRKRGKQHYSMVSTNGCPVSETCTVTISTTI